MREKRKCKRKRDRLSLRTSLSILSPLLKERDSLKYSRDVQANLLFLDQCKKYCTHVGLFNYKLLYHPPFLSLSSLSLEYCKKAKKGHL